MRLAVQHPGRMRGGTLASRRKIDDSYIWKKLEKRFLSYVIESDKRGPKKSTHMEQPAPSTCYTIRKELSGGNTMLHSALRAFHE